MTSARILIVDDDPAARRALRACLQRDNHRVVEAASAAEARAAYGETPFDAAIIDVHLGAENGFDLLSAMRSEVPYTRVFIVTADGTIDLAVKAMSEGAVGFLAKPFDFKKIRESMGRSLEALLGAGDRVGPQGLSWSEDLGLIGHSAAITQVRLDIEKMSDADSTVLILGESGTGKEVVAKALHQLSARARQRFEAINCAAIPANLLESELFGYKRGAFTDAKTDRKGLFALTSDGSLFLDEIGEMGLTLQAKLLRVLEEKELTPLGASMSERINTRVIAATNQDLQTLVAKGSFRADLFFRLSVLCITLPPLRERREDIPLLVLHFLKKFNTRFKKAVKPPSHEVMARLLAYDWPGNVRELQNSIERAVVMTVGDRLEMTDIFNEPRQREADHLGPELMGMNLSDAMRAFERDYLQRLLEATQGNVSEASRLSGRYRADLYRLFTKHGLEPGDFKPIDPSAEACQTAGSAG